MVTDYILKEFIFWEWTILLNQSHNKIILLTNHFECRAGKKLITSLPVWLHMCMQHAGNHQINLERFQMQDWKKLKKKDWKLSRYFPNSENVFTFLFIWRRIFSIYLPGFMALNEQCERKDAASLCHFLFCLFSDVAVFSCMSFQCWLSQWSESQAPVTVMTKYTANHFLLLGHCVLQNAKQTEMKHCQTPWRWSLSFGLSWSFLTFIRVAMNVAPHNSDQLLLCKGVGLLRFYWWSFAVLSWAVPELNYLNSACIAPWTVRILWGGKLDTEVTKIRKDEHKFANRWC